MSGVIHPKPQGKLRHQAFWTRLESAFPLVGEVKFNEPLKRYTSFGIGGPADCLVTVTSMEKLLKLMCLVNEYQQHPGSDRATCPSGQRNAPHPGTRGLGGKGTGGHGDWGTRGQGDISPPPRLPVSPSPRLPVSPSPSVRGQVRMPFFVLGKGTNLLVRDGGIRGLVVRLAGEFSQATVQEDQIIAGAGCPLSSLLRLSIQHGLSGLEFAVGIPGSLGGAVYTNAGSAEEGIGSLVRQVHLVRADGSTEVRSATSGEGCASLEFSYRRCSLSPDMGAQNAPEFVITRMMGFSPFGTRSHRDHENAQELIITRASVQLRQVERTQAIVAQIRERYRYRAAHQPLREKSAGCIFKNPHGGSAGKLIDQAGLKGVSVGGAQISTIHANFINNRDNASCSDVLQLMDMIQTRVYHSFGIVLEPEVLVVGEDKIKKMVQGSGLKDG